jgi:hypothetical protein
MAKKKLEEEIYYSERVSDDKYEYRHVILPRQLVSKGR